MKTRESYRDLGQRVSLSAPAVRDRLKKLQGRGILQGYWLSVDPSVFDRDNLLVFFRGEWSRRDAVKVLGVPDVAWVAWKVDGGLTVQVWPHDRITPIKDLTATLGVRPSGQLLVERKAHRPLTSLDWQIIDVLFDDPRMALKDLVGKTGLSPKTARKHLEMLVQGETIFITPKLGALAASGELVYTLAVFGSVGMGELQRILGDVYLVNEAHEPPAKYLLCLAADLADVTVKTKAIGKLSGVESVTLTLNREQLVATEFAHSLIRGQIQDFEKARGRSSANEANRIC
jgi:DNA-binding Lrp family transcriptional regulator